LSNSAFLLFQDLPPLNVAEVKKTNGAISLELRVPAREELEEGFWSFLDEYGFHTKGSSRRRRLFPEEVLVLDKDLFLL
jgi:DNA-directed RNA polymerase-5 subunit 1